MCSVVLFTAAEKFLNDDLNKLDRFCTVTSGSDPGLNLQDECYSWCNLTFVQVDLQVLSGHSSVFMFCSGPEPEHRRSDFLLLLCETRVQLRFRF